MIGNQNIDNREQSPKIIQANNAIRPGGGGGVVLRAKAQENAQTDGKLSVKLVDSDGAVTGDAFDIYVFPSKATTNYTTWVNHATGLPIATNDFLLTSKCFSDWFLVAPTLLNIGTKTDTVSSSATTIGGRFISNWLEEW